MNTDVNRRVLPGFGLSLGYTIFYMTLLVAIPIAAGFLKASQLSLDAFWAAVSSERAIAAYQLTVGASLLPAINVVRVLVAWVLVRYAFPISGCSLARDLPFASPPRAGSLLALRRHRLVRGASSCPLASRAPTATGNRPCAVFTLPFVVRTLHRPRRAHLDVERRGAWGERFQTWRVVRRHRPAASPILAPVRGAALGESAPSCRSGTCRSAPRRARPVVALLEDSLPRGHGDRVVAPCLVHHSLRITSST